MHFVVGNGRGAVNMGQVVVPPRPTDGVHLKARGDGMRFAKSRDASEPEFVRNPVKVIPESKGKVY